MQFPILLNRTTYEQTLPISLKSIEFYSELLKAPKTLKDFLHQFKHKGEIFDLQERHNNNNDLGLPNKNFFFNNYTVDMFLFVTAVILLVVTTIVVYILCKHKKLKSLVTSPCFPAIKDVG